MELDDLDDGELFDDFTTVTPWEKFVGSLESALRDWGLHLGGTPWGTSPSSSLHLTRSSSSSSTPKSSLLAQAALATSKAPGSPTSRELQNKSKTQPIDAPTSLANRTSSITVAHGDTLYTFTFHPFAGHVSSSLTSSNSGSSNGANDPPAPFSAPSSLAGSYGVISELTLSDNSVPDVVSGLKAPPNWPLISHPLHYWFGIPAFTILQPGEAPGSNPSDAPQLLSSAILAADSAGASVPVFVQVTTSSIPLPGQAPQLAQGQQGIPLSSSLIPGKAPAPATLPETQGVYVGYAIHPSSESWTRFDVLSLPATPAGYTHLAGLLNEFALMLGLPSASPDALPNASVSVRYTYATSLLPSSELQSEASETSAGLQSSLLGDLVLVGYISTPPVAGLALAADWPAFSAHAVWDNAVFSQLDPLTAPTWYLRAIFDLEPASRSNAQPPAASASLDPTNPSISTFLPSVLDLESSSSDHALDIDNLHLTSGLDRLLDSYEVVHHFPTLESLLGPAREQGGDNTTALDDALKVCFDLHTTTSESDKMFSSGLKATSPGSLLSLVAVQVPEQEGLRGALKLWVEVVRELRYHWERLLPLPHIGSGPPDWSTCLLQQKMQMVAFCIARRLEASNQDELDLEQDSTKPAETKSQSSSNSPTPSSSPPLDSGSDADNFFDADGVPDPSTSPPPERTSAEDPDIDDGDDIDVEDDADPLLPNSHPVLTTPVTPSAKPAGVDIVYKEGTISLLKYPDRALVVPKLQDPPVQTEEAFEAQMALFSKMGTGEAAAAERARLQSRSLLSDIRAFKAANPGCIMADFVRWHSPRDWTAHDPEDPDSDALGTLSPRMRAKDNLWLHMWKTSSPLPISKQAPLFDAVREGEMALHDLEQAAPLDVMTQLRDVFLDSCLARLALCPSYKSVPAVQSALKSAAATFTSSMDDRIAITSALANAESTAARADALLGAWPSKPDQVSSLLDGTWVELGSSGPVRRAAAKLVAEDGDLESPDRKEFVLRAQLARPSGDNAPELPHKMYAMIQSRGTTQFRLATAISSSE